MIAPELLSLLRCPVDGTQLVVADDELIGRVNAAIDEGRCRDRGDQKVQARIEGGLVSPRAQLLYPIRDSIPTMIADEAITLGELP